MTPPATFWEAAPAVAGLAGFAGVGARVAKSLLDLVRRDDPDSSPAVISRTEDPIAEVPVEVSQDEAQELRRKGIPVKTAGESYLNRMGALDAFGVGALGTLSLLGGWKLADKVLDAQRKSEAEAAREKVRRRIQAILSDKPEPEDVGLHAQMKAAEAVYMEKKAFDITSWLGLKGGVVNPLAALLGATLTISGLQAYNTAYAGSEDTGKIKALKSYLKKMKVKPPLVTVTPFVRRNTQSPADQAAENTQGV